MKEKKPIDLAALEAVTATFAGFVSDKTRCLCGVLYLKRTQTEMAEMFGYTPSFVSMELTKLKQLKYDWKIFNLRATRAFTKNSDGKEEKKIKVHINVKRSDVTKIMDERRIAPVDPRNWNKAFIAVAIKHLGLRNQKVLAEFLDRSQPHISILIKELKKEGKI
jgi:DNA-binding MarR family transcriptional regulator